MLNTKYFFTILLTLYLFFTIKFIYAKDILKLSTTTSTENSGLLAVLHPAFEKKHNIRIDEIAVGTGKALKIGKYGDVDVVLVHAPKDEIKLVKQGYFVNRSLVMYNDFVILGPESDPANIALTKTAVKALTKIATKQATFISRGDNSGTHKKELFLWQQANIKPKGKWYAATGQGMGATLIIADNKLGYVLTDRGTQIAYADKINLKILFADNEKLFNPYHVLAVNPKKHRHVKYVLAKKYIDFVISKQGQKIIANYKKAGQQLFYPRP